MCACIYTYTHIYIYIYIKRERKRKKGEKCDEQWLFFRNNIDVYQNALETISPKLLKIKHKKCHVHKNNKKNSIGSITIPLLDFLI